MFDVEIVREDFPILRSGVIYLDNAASSLTPEPVLQKMLEFYHEYRANVERGKYRLSSKATDEYATARKKIAHFINTKSSSEIVTTRNTTEGINIIANGLRWNRGDKVVTTLVEHHSNFIVWLRLKQRYGVDVKAVKPRAPLKYGILGSADFEKAIDDQTKLVAVIHISNCLGTIEPIKEITKVAHERGAYVLVDAAQSVPHIKVDVQKIGCDFLAFSGHKMCGPTGSGALYIREGLMDKVEPLCIGGGTIKDVGIDYYTLERSPARFEAGTPAIAEAIGLGAAVDYLEKLGIENIERYERKLTKQIYEGFLQIPKVEIYGPEPRDKIAIQSFNVDNLNPNEVAAKLDRKAKIAVRSGHHCTLPLMKNIIKKTGTVRASAYFYNTEEEIEKLIKVVKQVAGK